MSLVSVEAERKWACENEGKVQVFAFCLAQLVQLHELAVLILDDCL